MARCQLFQQIMWKLVLKQKKGEGGWGDPGTKSKVFHLFFCVSGGDSSFGRPHSRCHFVIDEQVAARQLDH